MTTVSTSTSADKDAEHGPVMLERPILDYGSGSEQLLRMRSFFEIVEAGAGEAKIGDVAQLETSPRPPEIRFVGEKNRTAYFRTFPSDGIFLIFFCPEYW